MPREARLSSVLPVTDDFLPKFKSRSQEGRRYLENGISIGYENVGLNSDEVSRPHAHEPAYFSLIVHGDCDEIIESERQRVRLWDLAFHPPGEVHARIPNSTVYGAFGMLVPSNVLDRLESDLGRKLEPSRTVSTIQPGLRLAQEWLQPGPISDLALTAIFYESLALAARVNTHEPRPPSWLRKAKDLLHEECVPSLSEVAAAVGISPSHLARQFRKSFGMTVGEYVRTLRLEGARHRLGRSEATVAQIATETGFADEAHFNKLFKRRYGVTPGAYRRSPF